MEYNDNSKYDNNFYGNYYSKSKKPIIFIVFLILIIGGVSFLVFQKIYNNDNFTNKECSLSFDSQNYDVQLGDIIEGYLYSDDEEKNLCKITNISSSNTEIMDVEYNKEIVDNKYTFYVIGKNKGNAKLNVTCENKVKMSILVKVYDSMVFDEKSYSITEGKKISLNLKVKDTKDLKIVSSDESVVVSDVKVSDTNPEMVTVTLDGVKDGNSTITAQNKNGVIQSTTITVYSKTGTLTMYFGNSNYSIKEGAELLATLTAQYGNNELCKIKSIKSSDNSIATVNFSNKISNNKYLFYIKGIKKGNVVLTATCENNQQVLTNVRVTEKDVNNLPDIILPDEINENAIERQVSDNLDFDVLEMMKGQSVILKPSKSNEKIVYTSSNPSILQVNQNGKITGKNVGYATVTIESLTVNKKINVFVKIPVHKLSFENQSYKMFEGEKKTLSPTISPKTATNKLLLWECSNSKIATIDKYGVITAKNSGTAIITVSSTDGPVAKVNLTVEKPILVKSVSIDSNDLVLNKGNTKKLTVTISPSNATNKNITWESSNTNVATVDKNGNVTAKNEGKATITVSSPDGPVAKVNLTVEKTILVKSVSIDSNDLVLNKGNTKKLTVTISPSNATNKNITWESSNINVATVDKNGNVTAKNEGNATITAKTNNNKSDTITVKVSAATSSVNMHLDVTRKTLSVGDKFKINAIFDSNVNKNISVTWTSDNSNVATVKDGLVTAKWGGMATITAKTSTSQIAKATIIVQNHNLILDSQFLKTEGTKIVRNGNPIVLKGFNLGVWLSRSGPFMPIKPYASDKNDLDSKGLSCINHEAILQLLSRNPNVIKEASNQGKSVETVVQDLSNILYNNFITEQDFDIISQTGANVIRLPFEYGLFLYEEKGNFYYSETRAKAAFKRIDWVIDQCKKRGIYVIIDFHLAPGRQNSGGYCGEQMFFGKQNSQKYQNVVAEMWKKIADRYKNESAVAGYDILNEPETNKDSLVAFYDKIYKVIRSVDKKHIIFMEETCVFCGYTGINNSSSIGALPNPSTKGWSNVVYSTHDYFFKTGNVENFDTSASEIEKRMNQKTKLTISKRNSYNIPYYIGEFSHLGKTSNPTEYLNVWKNAMTLYSKNGLSFTPWTYKAHWDRYYGLVFYGSKSNVSGDKKVDLLNDSYKRIKEVFMYKSTEAMNFNNNFYKVFVEQYGGRLAKEIKFVTNKVELSINESTTVNYVVYPNNAINKQVTWSSSDSSIVEVNSSTGKITAKKTGTATITASLKPIVYSGETIKATYTVVVK